MYYFNKGCKTVQNYLLDKFEGTNL